jgi:hypothetical protein
MISIFELKNKSFCRCFIKTPFYIKNLFLLACLAVFLIFVQLVYFGNEGIYVKSIKKLLRGLNSDVFNYLNEHRDPLGFQKTLPNYKLSPMSSQFFATMCLRLSRPCLMEGLAKKSGAFEKWRFNSSSTPYGYLLEKLDERPVGVYVDTDPLNITFSNPAYNSFKTDTMTQTSYKDFLN